MGDRQFAFAHHFKPFFDVIQSDMWVVIVGIAGGIEAYSVVFHDDLDKLVSLSCRNGNMYRIVAFAHTVLDGVFYDRLKRQRRYAENPERRIKIDKERMLLYHSFQIIIHSKVALIGGLFLFKLSAVFKVKMCASYRVIPVVRIVGKQ